MLVIFIVYILGIILDSFCSSFSISLDNYFLNVSVLLSSFTRATRAQKGVMFLIFLSYFYFILLVSIYQNIEYKRAQTHIEFHHVL